MSTQSADVKRVCKAHKVVHTKVRNRLNKKPVHQLICCYVNFRLIRKIEDEKDKRASSRVDTDVGHCEDFFEAALFDNIKDEREQEEAEILFAASTGNLERDDHDDSDDNDSDELSI